MATLFLLIDTLAQLTVMRLKILFPLCYVVTFKQLFGYGWWGTLWRLFFCFAIYFGLIVFVLFAATIWFNAGTNFG